MKVHFLGIGGSGESAIAAISQAQGFEITGCDLNPYNEFTKVFKENQLFTGHSPKHLDCDLLVVTPAIFSQDPNNPELKEAKNIPILTWQKFLGKYLLKDKFVIAVCGTHGKSTTTAMIGQMLEDAGGDPTVELGAIVPSWGSNFRRGKGRYFVVEADEFNDNFLNYTPDITVVTNIEMDHPEYFKDLEAVKISFAKFKSQSKKVFDKPNSKLIKFKLKVPGEFNVANASLAFQVGLALGFNPKIIRESLASYKGVGRRFEYLGKFKGADVYSDFGHHPTEIKVTIEAAREKFPDRKLWLIYEPHMFTRTKYLFDDFVKVFKTLSADQIIILDIYPSREVDTGKVKSWQIVQSVKKTNVRYNSPEEIKNTLNREIAKGDVIFFMGAGDIDKLARKLADQTA